MQLFLNNLAETIATFISTLKKNLCVKASLIFFFLSKYVIGFNQSITSSSKPCIIVNIKQLMLEKCLFFLVCSEVVLKLLCTQLGC